MKVVSVRTLLILLSLSLVVVSSVICLVLAVTAGEEAIKKTKESGDGAFADALIIADDQINLLASDLMLSILTTSASYGGPE